MILLDKPFVSEFLWETLIENNIPVIENNSLTDLKTDRKLNTINEEDAIKLLKDYPETPLYTNSENAINWISENLQFTKLPEKIELFKNKVKYRNSTAHLYPELFYRAYQYEDLRLINIEELPSPFIIKPAVGFFSIGVYKVYNKSDWEQTLTEIQKEINKLNSTYPSVVVDGTTYIVEEFIEGDEYAFDAYYDIDGNPVILNIYRHLFSSDKDVGDRIYMTSKEIIEENMEAFNDFLVQTGKLFNLKNFPLHIEVRKSAKGKLIPIEINPLRFGGWCTTADMTWHAYQINTYHYYQQQIKPDWNTILNGKEGKIYSIIILNNSTGEDANDILEFNYDDLLSKFEKPLELRKTDYKRFPLFAFLFAETRKENYAELEYILTSNLREFIRT
jgi:hypothetical protein